jgi:hypothetical protein
MPFINAQNLTIKQRKTVEKKASRLCTEMSKGWSINILDLTKMQRCACDAIASGRSDDGVRLALLDWLNANAKKVS